MAHQWYAIQTYAGSERSVKKAIEIMAKDYGWEDKIKDVVVPTEEVIEVKNGQKKITEALYIPVMFCQYRLDVSLGHKIPEITKSIEINRESRKTLQPSLGGFRIFKFILWKRMGTRKGTNLRSKKLILEPGEEMVRMVDGPFSNFNREWWKSMTWIMEN